MPTREDREQPDRELILEDTRSIREGLWRMVRLAQDTSESLDARINGEEPDGQAEIVEVREAQERLQVFSLKVSEKVDAYQNKHSS